MTIRNFKVNLTSKQLLNVNYLWWTFYLSLCMVITQLRKTIWKIVVGQGVDLQELKGTKKSPALTLIRLLRGM